MNDLISRQAAIDAVKAYLGDYEISRTVQCRLRLLPSAQPEPHEGHWIKHIDPFDGEQYECSECGVLWEFNDGTPEDNEAFYCPKCGTKMKGEQDGH
jgi:rubrerythrin